MDGRSAALDSSSLDTASLDTASLDTAATSGPSLRPARRQTAILFGLLLFVQFAAAALEPMGDGEQESFLVPWWIVALGATLAWSPLLAVWAVFGPLRAAVRLPLTVWLAVAVNLVALYGFNRNMGGQNSQLFVLTAAWLLAFAVLQGPLWLIRSLRRWRLERPADAAGRQTSKSASQFSLRAILGWTLAVAVLLAAYRAVAPEADWEPEMAEAILFETGLMGFLVALGGLPVVALAWIVLADGRRRVLRSVLGLLIVLGVGGACAIVGASDFAEVSDILALEGGAVLNGLLSFWIVRVCGYQLRRHPKKSAAAVERTFAAPAPITRRRFAFAAAPLVVIAGGLVCSIPHRQEMWRRAEVDADWRSNSGINVVFNDQGQIASALYLQHEPITDETCRRLASLAELRDLSLTGSQLDDRQLALLASLTRLTSLDLSRTKLTDQGLEQLRRFPEIVSLNLSNTAITDAGIEHLKSMPKLETLQLTLTEISDRGLETLARLPALKSIDAQLTAVTAAGAQAFRQARPRATVECGASDTLLANWQTLARTVTMSAGGVQSMALINESVKIKRLHAQGKSTANGVPAGVTDAGLTTLSVVQTDLEELDLRDSEVTDQGILQLKTLKSLKRLDLRGSPVTEQGAASLARALPECEILR